LLCLEPVAIHVLRLPPSVEHLIRTVDPVVLAIFQEKILKASGGGNSKRHCQSDIEKSRAIYTWLWSNPLLWRSPIFEKWLLVTIQDLKVLGEYYTL
jgi:hypothetical protein